jgi:hypothetical protein
VKVNGPGSPRVSRDCFSLEQQRQDHARRGNARRQYEYHYDHIAERVALFGLAAEPCNATAVGAADRPALAISPCSPA